MLDLCLNKGLTRFPFSFLRLVFLNIRNVLNIRLLYFSKLIKNYSDFVFANFIKNK